MTDILSDIIWFTLSFGKIFHNADCTCDLPFYYNGDYEIAEKGQLYANTTLIYQYPVNILLGVNHLHFACREKQENTYLLKSTEDVNLFGQQAKVYLCMDIHKVSNETYYYFHRTAYDAFLLDHVFASKLREATFDEVCTKSPDPKTFKMMVKAGALQEGLLNTTCPEDILVVFDQRNITKSGDKTTGCPGTGLDVCTDRSTLMFTYNDTCTKASLTSDSGRYSCLYWMTSGTSTYLGLRNHDTIVDDADNFRFSCFAYSYQNNILYATETPNSCTDTTTSTDLGSASEGVILSAWNIILRCPDREPVVETDEEPTDLSWLYYLFVGLGVVLLLALLLFLSCCLYKKYGCVCKHVKPLKTKIPKFGFGPKNQLINGHESKNEKYEIAPAVLETLSRPTNNIIVFKPKQQIRDFTVLSTVFKERTIPTIIIRPKVSPIYNTSLEDYLEREPEVISTKMGIFRLDSGVFEDDIDNDFNSNDM